MRSTSFAIGLVGLVMACGGSRAGLKLQAGTATTAAKAALDFSCRPSSLERRFFCTQDKTLLGQETTLLGTVYKVEPVGTTCPAPFSPDERREPVVPGLDKQALSLTNAVTTQVDFALVNRTVTSSVKALAFLDSSLDRDAVASVELLRTTRAVMEDEKFNRAITAFAARHPTACRLYVATGYAADYFTARVFTTAQARSGGGVYGVNVGGTYFASDETVKRDYQWALSIVRIDVGESDQKSVEPTLQIEPRLTDPAQAEVTGFTIPGAP